RLIDALVAAPDAKASRLVTLGPSAAQRMIVDWNRTAIDHGPDRNILQTIERELRRRPHAIVAEEDVEPGTPRPRIRQMSARALLRESWNVARGLAKAGVEPEAPVA